MRTPIIAGNWKMHLGRSPEALDFVRQIRYPLNNMVQVQSVICPPFTVLFGLFEILATSRIALGAQTMHWEEKGAYTGEISASMLTSICQYVIIGHSERRSGRVFSPEQEKGQIGEGNVAVNYKVHAALEHKLIPIICVGENMEQKRAGLTQKFIQAQVTAAFAGLTAQQAGQCVIAYEPIWAIGSGKAASPVDANRVIGLTIRGTLKQLYDEETAQRVRVQYGGSVNKHNIKDFMAMPEIDGALVGGASLTLDFVELVRQTQRIKC